MLTARNCAIFPAISKTSPPPPLFPLAPQGGAGGPGFFGGPKVFLRDSTMVTPYAVLLFGGPLRVHHKEGIVTVGDKGWGESHWEK